MKALVTSLVLAIVSGSGAAASQEASSDVWASLKHKTGWIVIGVVDVRQYDDMLASQPSVVRVGSRDEHRFRIPRTGDRVTVVAPVRLLLKDFKTDGERHRGEPPIRKEMSPGDETGMFLPVGATVKIVAFARDKPDVQGLQLVVARVVPSP